MVQGWTDSAVGRMVILADRCSPQGNVRLTPWLRKTQPTRVDLKKKKRTWGTNILKALFLLSGAGIHDSDFEWKFELFTAIKTGL